MDIPKHLQLLDDLFGDPTGEGERLTSNEFSERMPLMLLAESLRFRSSGGQVCFRSTAPSKTRDASSPLFTSQSPSGDNRPVPPRQPFAPHRIKAWRSTAVRMTFCGGDQVFPRRFTSRLRSTRPAHNTRALRTHALARNFLTAGLLPQKKICVPLLCGRLTPPAQKLPHSP